MTEITINASKKYPVAIGDGLLEKSGEYIKETIGKCRIAVICDDIVDKLHGDKLNSALNDFETEKFVFENGEKSKNLRTYCEILEFLAKNRFTRSDAIVAFGGGVTGDMAGFAAATYLRGVRFVQIPTTLLAAVDSSVGGKTAVDLAAGKNLCGAFWHPEAVICDYTLLDTLPDNIFSDGMAEVIKAAVIRSSGLFTRLSSPVREEPEDVIAECVRIKRDVVNEDERDTGVRAILNFGHTAAHGIEKYSEYTVSHGKAVAIGMVIASRAAEKWGMCESGTTSAIREMLKIHGLPDACTFSPEQLTNAALSDKKRNGENITLVLPKKIGSCFLKKIPVSGLADFFRAGLTDF